MATNKVRKRKAHVNDGCLESIDDLESAKHGGNDHINFAECKELAEKIKLMRPEEQCAEPKLMKMTENGSSWMLHVSNYKKPPSQELFEKMWDGHPKDRKSLGMLYGRPAFENRFSQTYGDKSYSYSGYKENSSSARPISDDPILSDLINEIHSLVDPSRGPFNGCLTNWYLPEHTIASHADDEKQLKIHHPIFSLSWGGPRRFLVKPKRGVIGATSADILINCGDLVIMGGTLQDTHKHEVPKWRKTKDVFIPGRRINWTVRAFK